MKDIFAKKEIYRKDKDGNIDYIKVDGKKVPVVIDYELLTVNILGTEYKLIERKISEDDCMKKNQYAGYCAEEIKEIVIADMSEEEYFGEMTDTEKEIYRKKTLRHELIHAYLNESGLSAYAHVPNGGWAKCEELVDWIAIQSPKIFKTFMELELI